MPATSTQIAVEEQQVYVFPCSIVQRTCWYLDQLTPHSSTFNIAVRFILQGTLSVEALEKSIQYIVQRHDILRTRFISDAGEPKQVVEAVLEFSVSVTDLCHLGEPDRSAEADRISLQEAEQPFDIQTGPLFRGSLVKIARDQHILLLTMHHIIGDGWSVGVVTEEIRAVYDSIAQKIKPRLSELPLQYGDYACWQRDWINSGELAHALDHLKNKFDGFSSLYIPTDYPRPLSQTSRGEIRSILLPRGLTDTLQKVGDRQGCTLFVVMYSALLALLHQQSGQNDIVIRTQTSGRDQFELEPMIGWFVNSIVLRARIPDEASFLEVIDLARAEVLEGLEHQQVPFERLMDVIRPKQDTVRHPPFQVNFIFQRDFVRPWDAAGIKLIPIPSKSTGTFVDLNFFLVEREDGWRCSIDINTAVFSTKTGDYFLNAFRKLLETVADNPRIQLARIMKSPRPAIGQSHTALADLSFNNFVPARNEPERAVIEIWARILNFQGIGAYSNFFDLGGHSLLAVRLLDEFQARFGHTVELSKLFLDPTPAAMARVVTGEEVYSDPRQMIPVQPNGDRPPFFMIGGDHWFRPLALTLGLNQPFIGVPLLRYRNFNQGERREFIAKEVADLIVETYGNQHYILGGWCADGLTALEVGRAIQAAGGKVAAVVLFDSMNPDYYRHARALVHSAGRTVTSLRGIARQCASRGIFSSALSMIRALFGVLSRIAKRIAETARPQYSCAEVTFPLVIVRPPIGSLEEPALGWKTAATAGLTVLETPGDHSSIFKEPYVHELGSKLRKHLDVVVKNLRPDAE